MNTTEIIKTHSKKIKSVKDVKSFLNDLHDFGLSDGFHPDTPFADYIGEKGELFTEKEAGELDIILGDCFKVCEANKKDIYQISFDQFQSKRGKEIKKAFDAAIKKSFDLTESFEEILNNKMKEQGEDYLNYKHVQDVLDFNKAITAAIDKLNTTQN